MTERNTSKHFKLSTLGYHEKICMSPIGRGVFTNISSAGWPEVDGVAVGWMVTEGGQVFDPDGIRPTVITGENRSNATGDDVEQEDRGMPCVVWWSGEMDCCTFNWFPGAKQLMISIPIGHTMAIDPELGAVIRNVFGKKFGPRKAAFLARSGQDGFRIREDAT